jgi:hypothetical protein
MVDPVQHRQDGTIRAQRGSEIVDLSIEVVSR